MVISVGGDNSSDDTGEHQGEASEEDFMSFQIRRHEFFRLALPFVWLITLSHVEEPLGGGGMKKKLNLVELFTEIALQTHVNQSADSKVNSVRRYHCAQHVISPSCHVHILCAESLEEVAD